VPQDEGGLSVHNKEERGSVKGLKERGTAARCQEKPPERSKSK